MNYLIVTHIKFWNKSQGSEYALSDRVSNLSGKKAIVFIGKITDEDRSKAAKYNVTLYQLYSIKYLLHRALRLLISKLGLNIYYFQKPHNFSLLAKKKVASIAKKEDVDCVICEYVWFHNLINFIDKKVCRIIDTHDIQHIFCAQNSKIDKNWRLNISKADEFKIYSNKFNYVIAISEDDYQFFSKELTNCVCIPPTYPIQKFIPVNGNKLSIGFIGGGAQFNVDSVRWFIDNVMAFIDDVNFNVYGKVCGAFQKEKNTTFVGAVNNIDDVYRDNHIMVNPTFISGGIKTKNVEALSYGRYVLTTTYGTRGLKEFVDKGYVVVCDEAKDFIEYINSHKNKLDSYQNGDKIIDSFKKVFSKDRYIDLERKISIFRDSIK